MRSTLFSWLFFIIVLPNLLYVNTNIVSGQCLNDQKLLLLELNKSLIFNEFITAGMSWNQTSDCCRFQGVTCDEEGHVTGLNLSNKMIIGGLDNSSTLFDLQHLQNLDLSNNRFNSSIPSRIGELTNLTYLNLSNAQFMGQIPREISHLRRLVVLDMANPMDLLSPSFNWLKLENPNLSELLRNHTDLRELYLDWVNIYSSGEDWFQGLSSSLHNLQVLSMRACRLFGPIGSSLAKLQSLAVLRLSSNSFSSPVPEFFANFSNLTELSLESSDLNGTFPKEIFQMPTLKVLAISGNPSLHVSFPEFPQINSFEELELSQTNLLGPLPTSIGKLLNLSKLSLQGCQLNGTFPKYLTKLRRLVYVDLSNNNFSGVIPQFLFSLPSLQEIRLHHNKFSGQLPEFPNASSSLLTNLVLSYNNLESHIPMSTFQLKNLKFLSLSYNKFNGTINFINMIQGLPNLDILYLSRNNLTVEVSDKEEDSTVSSLPKLGSLDLAFCRMRKFPLFLKNQTVLSYLDLSDNQIGGEIPSWIWELGSGRLSYLNLSSNQLVRMQEPYSPNTLKFLDLHNNQLIGTISKLPSANFIDLSRNSITSIPVDIGHYIESLQFLSLSNNRLTGVIPQSLCNGSSLQSLDLSNNHFNGSIPTCIFKMNDNLNLLKLQNNRFNGIIADEFRIGCGLRTLQLNGNEIGGRIPRSLANCNFLEVLDLGNNNMVDTFPLFLNTSELHVLVLRSNKFYGRIDCSKTYPNWKRLQIIDISHNHFGGELPMQCLMTWKAMIVDQSPNNQTVSTYLSDFIYFKGTFYQGTYYEDTIMVANKGLHMKLERILTIFTCIDFSSNNFTGQIPKELGQLQLLYVLNLSHNSLTYHLPSSLGNLHHLESLDLSWNQLNGTIPPSLANLNFPAVFNISYNQLVGKIPKGNQFQTFPPDSFIGNKDLSGCPLVNCSNDENSPKVVTDVVPRTEIDWDVIFAVIGFGFGFGVVTVPLVFSKRWRKLYFKRVEDIGYKIIPLFILKKWWMWKARWQGRGQQRR